MSSAGLSPQEPADAANAIRLLLEEYGIDASSHVPRGLVGVDFGAYDFVIALDEHVRAQLRADVPDEKLLFWNVDDPWGDWAQYRVCARQTEKHLAQLSKLLCPQR